MQYKLVENYKDDEKLVKSFNELTEKTFGFNFIEWQNNGFWTEKYIPYSLVNNNQIIANVSVNLMDFMLDGVKKHYIQLGTVMTDENYRRQGLCRYLMEHVIKEYQHKVDGIYLFGNDSVIHFYPKFGFVESKEYQYIKSICSTSSQEVEQIDMSIQSNRDCFLNIVKNSTINERFTTDNWGLIAVYLLFGQPVYYLAKEEAYILANVEKEKLFIHQIVTKHEVNLESIIHAFGSEIQEVRLGFTPVKSSGYEVKEVEEDDCTLFILGKDLKEIEKKKLMFPTLSHA
ncbi:GNAT family N-acetyltransferase [Turicibacter sp.]|uniref:GNAT family N-acetyltransferase n=1 Tax=Turicibacter sp. TaxID=2049042 RepID=UPI001B6802EB|nr:GNAT family N-acetyltransferase [Turicibacter sp.]MBP3904893.1 GNAT family N-acetyltransferase [Turicibacter sp.]